MTRIAQLAATALSAAVLITGTLASPTHAETSTITDRANDGSSGAGGPGPRKYGDIGEVRVNHAPHRLHVKVLPARHGQLADFYSIYVDVDRADPGPELVVTTSAETERYSVARTDGFGYGSGSVCRGRADWGFGRGQTVAVSVARSCLAIDGLEPERLRVSVRSEMEYERADWAPGRRAFGPWVTPGAA